MNGRNDRIDKHSQWAKIGFAYGTIIGIIRSGNRPLDNIDFFVLALCANLPKLVTLPYSFIRPERTLFSNKEWFTYTTAFTVGLMAAMHLFSVLNPSNRPESRF